MIITLVFSRVSDGKIDEMSPERNAFKLFRFTCYSNIQVTDMNQKGKKRRKCLQATGNRNTLFHVW
jgi:hypothetical protein